MSKAIHHTAFGADTSATRDILMRDGAVIVDNVLRRDEYSAVMRDARVVAGTAPTGDSLFFGRNTRRCGRLFSKVPGLQHLACDPRLLEIVEPVLLQACSSIQINLTQLIQIEAGEPGQVFHRDDEFFPCEKGDSEFMINVMLAVTPFSRENGATRVVLNDKRGGDPQRQPEDHEISYAEMEPGSALIWLGSALHAGGANTTSLPRLGMVLSYSAGWLRQAENQYLAYDINEVRRFPTRLQQMLGYQIHVPNLGWYEGQDPAVVLQDRLPEQLPAKDYLPPHLSELLEAYYAQRKTAS